MKVFALAMVSVLLSANSAAIEIDTPVMVGQEPDLDACTSLAIVAGLKHSLLAVRGGPGSDRRQVDSLANGQELYICDSSQKSPWVGVVYAKGQRIECGVTSPSGSLHAYAGPCRHGWVSTRWVKVIAG